MRGSMTIAVASFACHWATVCSRICSAFAWMWLSSVRKTSLPFATGCGLLRLDDLAERVADDDRLARAAPRAPRSSCELETPSRCVGAHVAEHRRGDGPLRIDAPLVGLEREAR